MNKSINTVELIKKWFIKRKKTTNREVIHKYDYLHGISDIVFNMKKHGHIIETERVQSPIGKHYVIYHYKGQSKSAKK